MIIGNCKIDLSGGFGHFTPVWDDDNSQFLVFECIKCCAIDIAVGNLALFRWWIFTWLERWQKFRQHSSNYQLDISKFLRLPLTGSRNGSWAFLHVPNNLDEIIEIVNWWGFFISYEWSRIAVNLPAGSCSTQFLCALCPLDTSCHFVLTQFFCWRSLIFCDCASWFLNVEAGI